MNLNNSDGSMQSKDEKNKRTLKESIKLSVQELLDTKVSFKVKDIKGRFETKEVSKI